MKRNGIAILAGSISDGKDIAAAEALGADFVYMGTRFIAAEESLASKEYQNMLIDSTIEVLIYTDAFSGVNANYLMPSIRKAGLDPDNLQKKTEINFSKMNRPGAKAWKDIWSAGQGVHSIKKIQPVVEIVKELKQSYEKTLSLLAAKHRQNS